MIHSRLLIGINVAGCDHMDLFIIAEGDFFEIKSIRRDSSITLAENDVKLIQLDPLTPYVPTTQTVDPSVMSKLAAMTLPEVS